MPVIAKRQSVQPLNVNVNKIQTWLYLGIFQQEKHKQKNPGTFPDFSVLEFSG